MNRHSKKPLKNKKIPKLSLPQNLFVTETNKIKNFNLKSILKYESGKTSLNFRTDFLQNHKINAEIRARMVDWMIEVLSSFNCTTNTFFVALDIMDNYMAKTQKCLGVKDIHILGVTSMLLASKMEEIIPFKVSTVVDKMTHGKISKSEIVNMEMDVIMTLDFKLLK